MENTEGGGTPSRLVCSCAARVEKPRDSVHTVVALFIGILREVDADVGLQGGPTTEGSCEISGPKSETTLASEFVKAWVVR